MVQGRSGTSVIKSSRLRSKANDQAQKLNDIEDRKDHQLELFNAKQVELKKRHARGEI